MTSIDYHYPNLCQAKNLERPEGFEPSTYRLRFGGSNQTELRAPQNLEPLDGIEPPTCELKVRCSGYIPLSYSGIGEASVD